MDFERWWKASYPMTRSLFAHSLVIDSERGEPTAIFEADRTSMANQRRMHRNTSSA